MKRTSRQQLIVLVMMLCGAFAFGALLGSIASGDLDGFFGPSLEQDATRFFDVMRQPKP